MLAAARSGRRLDQTSTLWPWLAKIGHNQAALHWRRHYRDRESISDVDQLTAADHDDPAVILTNSETVESVRCLLAEMDADHVALLAAKYIDDMSISEIVALFGGTTESVRSKLARARRDFREALPTCSGTVMRQESENDDRLLRQSLALLGEDAAAVDPIAIDRVRKLAGDELSQDTDDDSEQVVTVRDQPGGGRRSMITKAVLGISALAAAVLMLLQAPTSDDDKTLGSILDETLQAKTLKLAVDRDGTPAEVLVSKASLVRWQDSPTTYRIADGKQLWTIDERAGQAEASDSPWHHDSDQVDLLSLLGLNSEQSKKLRANASSESETIGGKKRYVFTSTAGKAVVHAYFDVASDQLSELRCWPGGFDPQVPPQKLFIVARDIRVDESQFVVAKHLSADGRIAKIIDTQGVVTLRPMLNKRWTPVGTQMLLKAGDWLRTDARGANASTLVTTSQFKVTVGPASLVELRSATELRLHRGELKVVGSKAASADLKLLGPKTAELSVAKGKSSHVRVDREGQLTKVDKKPAWLASLEGSSTVDPVGSLLTNIDGRETKLTVGFHKVKVEIRDQIARHHD